jgi:hypothetical protein
MKKTKVLTLTLFIFSIAFSIYAQSSMNKLPQPQTSEIKGYKEWTKVTNIPQLILNPSFFG